MQYTFEVLKPEELNELSDLLTLVFKRNHLYVGSKTNWAFGNNHSHVIVAKYDGKIIASRGGIEWPLKIDNSSIRAIQFHGTCVHPDHRRKGLFSSLNMRFLEYAREKNISCIFNVSVKISRLGYEKLGWRYINGFHRLTHFNKPLKFIKERFNKTPSVSKLSLNPEQLELMDSSFLTSREAQFKNVIHTDYSLDFLKWRLDNSRENYRVFKTDDAYVIYKISQTNRIKSLIFGEFFLMENSRAIFSSVIKKIIKKENPDITFTYISRYHPYFKYYLLNLFAPNPINFNLNFGTRVTSANIKNELENKKWGTSFLDIDTF